MLRGEAEDPLERAREVVGVGEPEFLGGLFDGAVAVAEQFHRAIHFEILQIPERRLPPESLKEAA